MAGVIIPDLELACLWFMVIAIMLYIYNCHSDWCMGSLISVGRRILNLRCGCSLSNSLVFSGIDRFYDKPNSIPSLHAGHSNVQKVTSAKETTIQSGGSHETSQDSVRLQLWHRGMYGPKPSSPLPLKLMGWPIYRSTTIVAQSIKSACFPIHPWQFTYQLMIGHSQPVFFTNMI